VSDRVTGRVAVVTGAAGGLGQVFCRALAREGAAVVGVDLTPMDTLGEQVAAAGGRFLGLTVDVTSEADVAGLADRVASEFGPADILVNNAGTYPLLSFKDTTYETWRAVHTLNVDGPFLMTKALVPGMVDAGWGRVVNIVSAAFLLGPPEMSAYVASKGALVGFTRSLATELGGTGVTVNALAPGLTRTETALSSGVAGEFDRVVSGQAVPRAAEPEDVESALLFMCDNGSAMLTGQLVNVDGGFAKH
jgi:NAD(P)-dependent dehydrogenase (short-subunit alcohol dehydrogenase family)